MIMVKIIEFDFLKGAGNGSYFAKAVHLSSQILTVTGRSIVLHKFANSVNSCPVHITDDLKQIAFFKYIFWQILLSPFRYLSSILLGSSLFTVGFISYDRCLHLVRLNQYNMPRWKMIPVLLLCWLVPIIIPLFRYSLHHFISSNLIWFKIQSIF